LANIKIRNKNATDCINIFSAFTYLWQILFESGLLLLCILLVFNLDNGNMKPEKKEVTIYDIAAKLNISVATVSRALRDHPAVNVKTKKKIFELAEAYGYQTNHFARNLRQQKTRTIGLIVPHLNSYFMATVISGIERVANQSGYNLLISQSSESPEREIEVVKTMFNNRVDGLLVSLSYSTESLKHFERFSQKNIPVMFFDRVSESSAFTNLRIDNVKAGYDATKHLLEMGCRNILHVSASSTHSIYRDRFKGYSLALEEYDAPLKPENIYISDLTFEAGKAAAHYALSLPTLPDGIFVANDNCASGCLITLKQKGIRIPEDIAIVGFNNDPVCLIVEPNLTSIQYPGYEMGEMAARNLINDLSGAENLILTQTIILRSELIVRASSLRQMKNRISTR